MRAFALLFTLLSAASADQLKVRLTWGHDAAVAAPYVVKLVPSSLEVRDAAGISLEPGESERGGAWQTTAGAGDVDGLEFTLSYTAQRSRIQDLHIIWADLIAAADAGTAQRLSRDASMYPGSPKLTIELNADAGFSVTVNQLLAEKALYVPALHAYITAAGVPFEQHRKSLSGTRILDRIRSEPEASYEQYTSRWEDMGHPGYENPQQRGPGHIVGLTWDSAIPKFGIDRGAGVWNDYGNPDQFRFWFAFADLEQGITRYWKGQRLTRGLPVITTILERDGLRYEVEQFAYPLDGPPPERRGDIAMTLLQKVRITELEGRARRVPVAMTHRRRMAAYFNSEPAMERQGSAVLVREAAFQRVLFSIEGAAGEPVWNGTRDYQKEQKRIDATVFADLPARGSTEFVVKLPSPPVEAAEAGKLVAIDYAAAREQTLKFWSGYVERGAEFSVPEEVVNDLFRASLWHALRLPRRHGGAGDNVRIDLPYSNFAYSQTGTPWPVNQAVYVDYMLYDLRGYHAISTEELSAQFRNNQESNGHIGGYANWLVYTPSMLYSVAQNFLLSGDRAGFDRLLPQSLKALDWCLDQVRLAKASGGLVSGPLNDGTGEGLWAFNQAYMFAGLDLFGRALESIEHPRAAEARSAARDVRAAIDGGFRAASVRSPIVQLRDGTWIPYVPCEARTPRRLLEQWYPTDVDTGAVHLARLKAIDPAGPLADWLLNDHEDNLYYKGWGIANEPVYNQQATAYLLRDDTAAVIRAFYSYIASAFSHSALEPVEHRWTHGQYFGPPSTDGAWFELYRNMLVRETDDNALLLGQAAPRAWLADGKKIEVRRAPTYFGPLSMTIDSQAASGRILADIEMPGRGRPGALLVRLRHPENRRIRSVTVNGRNWTDFDPAREWVRIPSPTEARYSVVVRY
jgi:hypothetical protein